MRADGFHRNLSQLGDRIHVMTAEQAHQFSMLGFGQREGPVEIRIGWQL